MHQICLQLHPPHRPRHRGPAQREQKCQPASSSTASVASTTVVSSTPLTTSDNYKGSESSGGESLPNFKCDQWDSDILKVDFFAWLKLLFCNFAQEKVQK